MLDKAWTTTGLKSVCVVILVLAMTGCGQLQDFPGSKDTVSEGTVKEEATEERLQAHRDDANAWHGDRLERLQTKDGWLTLVGLFWLEEGDNAVGSDAGHPVVLPSKVAATVGTVRLTVDAESGSAEAVFVPDADGGIEVVRQGPATGEIPLVADTAGDPTLLQSGTVTFYLIERSGRYGIRVKDSASEVRQSFDGVDRFDVDWHWRVVADYEPRTEPKFLEMPTAIGIVEKLNSPGTVRFEKDGVSYRLDAYESHDKEVWFVFGDQTNAKTTYGGGRFLYSQFDEGDTSQAGKLVVDFNRAYNPPCVFTAYATCPLATPDNRLATVVEAGEKKWADYAH